MDDRGGGTDAGGTSLVAHGLKQARKTLTDAKHSIGQMSRSVQSTERELYAEQAFLKVIMQKKQPASRIV